MFISFRYLLLVELQFVVSLSHRVIIRETNTNIHYVKRENFLIKKNFTLGNVSHGVARSNLR